MVGVREIQSCLVDIGILVDGTTVFPEESLFNLGVIDSLGIMTLVSELEARFNIRIPEIDLLPDNFDTINAIATYVNKRRNDAAVR